MKKTYNADGTVPWGPHWARELAVKQKELSVRKANSAKPSQSDFHRQEEEEEERIKKKEAKQQQRSQSVLAACDRNELAAWASCLNLPLRS